MRAQSELSLERADDGVRIHLSRGAIIVNAAMQSAGRLSVQTRDVTVSVAGTVIFVNAEEGGSRVAVIQGEVRVQHGAAVKILAAGEQVATNPLMDMLPVIQQIEWSRNAPAHFARLQPPAAPPATPQAEAKKAAAPARLEFAAASIKLLPPGTAIPGDALGLACRGTDGVERIVMVMQVANREEAIARGSEPVNAPQGTCMGRGVFLPTLIEMAYGISPQYIAGGPDWARQTRNRLPVIGNADGSFTFPTATAFQVEAASADPSTTTRQQLRQMLQAMLADRFKLEVHRETQESPGYALVVAGNGPGLKEIAGEYDEETRFLSPGRSTMGKLAQRLAHEINSPVVDKTGLAGAYEYRLFFTGRPPARADDFSAALEEQLGLRLQPENAVRVEMLVIDHVEQPE
jgi:uncharacterized protein (TIGR03435 family)